MAASKVKVWATLISFAASRIFFFFIIFQIPLFRFPCRIGTCTTPMELTSSEWIASKVIPAGIVKALLYPGATVKAIYKNKPIPNYNNVLEAYNMRNLKQSHMTTDLQHIEVLAGSYLAVVGAIVGLVESRRLGLFGMLLLIWGLSQKEHPSFENHKTAISVCYPTVTVVVLSAFISIKDDVKKIVSCFKWTFSKYKYK